MGFIESIVGIVIIMAFLIFIFSKIYSHEKESIDPLIKKIKGWFNKEDEDDFFNPSEDFDIAFRGQE